MAPVKKLSKQKIDFNAFKLKGVSSMKIISQLLPVGGVQFLAVGNQICGIVDSGINQQQRCEMPLPMPSQEMKLGFQTLPLNGPTPQQHQPRPTGLQQQLPNMLNIQRPNIQRPPNGMPITISLRRRRKSRSSHAPKRKKRNRRHRYHKSCRCKNTKCIQQIVTSSLNSSGIPSVSPSGNLNENLSAALNGNLSGNWTGNSSMPDSDKLDGVVFLLREIFCSQETFSIIENIIRNYIADNCYNLGPDIRNMLRACATSWSRQSFRQSSQLLNELNSNILPEVLAATLSPENEAELVSHVRRIIAVVTSKNPDVCPDRWLPKELKSAATGATSKKLFQSRVAIFCVLQSLSSCKTIDYATKIQLQQIVASTSNLLAAAIYLQSFAGVNRAFSND